MTSPKIPEGLQVFLRHADSLHPSNNPRRENGFAKEFQQLKDMSSKLKKDPEYTTHNGELDYNRPKNRYKDILPFDYNRIVLPTLPGVPGSDYINGNYIKGHDGKTAYLALQGPLPRTVDDFWRLIASHRCQIVIMVCREIEMGKLKCKRYWPENKDDILNFAGLEISLISEDNIAEGFVMRTMCMKSNKEEMTVTQLQYTAWPDHDVPKSATPLIELNRTLRAIQGNRKQVALIHCSAGCGRTGTICAVDYAWSLLKMQKTSDFSVYNIVANLRRQRMAMVQTKEQYALVYKAVVQLVQEELDNERLKSHTYVNVEIPGASKSPNGHSNYENCEFLNSVSRWKQNDLQNGSVPRALAPLPAPARKETKTNSQPQPQPANKKPMPRSKPDGAPVVKPNVPPAKTTDYVNVDFNKGASKTVPTTVVNDTGGASSAQPKSPTRGNIPSLNFDDVNSGSKGAAAVRQKSPTAVPDYEVLPKRVPGPGAGSAGNEKLPQKKKGFSADYEFPAICVPQKQSKEVPEGLLIDLGEDVPPLPTKRHSGDSSVNKDGSGTRYENVEVKPRSRPDLSALRSNSSPNVLDDSWLFGQPPMSTSPPGVHPIGSKENTDSRAFHTVPNRLHTDSGPKRCPLTAELFQDPSASGGGAVAASGGGSGGFGVMQPSQGQYCLVGAVSPSSPPKAMANPQFMQHHNQGSQPQKQRLPVEGGNSPQPKKPADQSKSRAPVGAYSLVGIPELPSQSPVLFAQNTAPNNTAVKTEPTKTKAGSPVEGKAQPVGAYSLVGIPELPGQSPVLKQNTTPTPTAVKSNPTKTNAGSPVEGKAKPIGAYSLVGIPELPGQSPVLISQNNASTSTSVKSEPTKGKAGSPVENKAKPITGIPADIKPSPITEPSYEFVGQWQQPAKKTSPPSVRPYQGDALANLDVKKGAKEEAQGSPRLPNKVEKQKSVAGNETIPVRGKGDGAPLEASNVTVVPDLYAAVVPRSSRENAERNSPKMSGGSPRLRPQSSTGSLRSVTSTSSDEGDTPPAIPQKTNEAFLVPGEEPYENVQQSSKAGTLDRFKKMMKNTSKGSLPKRLSDSALHQGAPRNNSLKTASTRLDEIGYKKRFAKPIGPRSSPAEWPSFGHLGL